MLTVIKKLLLLVLVLLPLLTGCAAPQTKFVPVSPDYPPMPYVTPPQPSGSWLQSVQGELNGLANDLVRWQLMLKSSTPKKP